MKFKFKNEMVYSIAIRLRIQSYELENPMVLDHILSNLIDHQFIVKHAYCMHRV